MKVNTAKLLNWQVSQALGLDPTESHTIIEEGECGCYSEYTRDDYTVIYVDGIKRYKEYEQGYRTEYYRISEFINHMAEQGMPDSLDGVAIAEIETIPVDCIIGDYYD